MRIRSADAMILEVRDLQERDRLISFLTAEYGLQRGVARGAKTKHSRFSGQLQLLARARIGWAEKEGRDLVRVSSVEMQRPVGGLEGDLEGLLLASYLAEHFVRFSVPEEPSSRLFRLLDTTLQALRDGVSRSLAARYVEIWVLRLAGVFPVPRDCPWCGQHFAGGAVLLAGEEELVCRNCVDAARHDSAQDSTLASADPAASSGLAVSAEAVHLLLRSGFQSLPELANEPPTDAVLAEVEAITGRVRRSFLQDELRSYQVMRRTLAEV